MYHTGQTQGGRWASFVVVGDEANDDAVSFSRDHAESRAAAAACKMLDELGEGGEIVEKDLNQMVAD